MILFERLPDISGYRVSYGSETAFLLTYHYNDLEVFQTRRELLEKLLKQAHRNFSSYSRRCPGRDFEEQAIAKYTMLLAQEAQP